MELYLIRHGIAVDRQIGIKDEERSLTEEGRQKTRRVAKRLKSLGLQFEVILSSPLVRSLQTAEILRDGGLSSQLQVSSHLAPDGDLQGWLSWLEQQEYLENTQLAMIGHQPDLGQWAEILLWREAKAAIVLKKAGVMGLKLPETGSPLGCSQLFWLTPPKLLL